MPLISVSYDSLYPFHGGNTGSNPVGDANILKDLRETPFFAGDTPGTQTFHPVAFSFVSRKIATTFPCAFRLAGVIACAYTSMVIFAEP